MPGWTWTARRCVWWEGGALLLGGRGARPPHPRLPLALACLPWAALPFCWRAPCRRGPCPRLFLVGLRAGTLTCEGGVDGNSSARCPRTSGSRLFRYAPGAVTGRPCPLLTAPSLRSSAVQRKRHGRAGWDCSGSGAPTSRYAGQRAGTSGRLFLDERRPFLTFVGLFAASYLSVGNVHQVLISRFFSS